MKNRTIRSGIWFTASNFLVKGIGFLTTPIFTRLLTKEEFGAFHNFTAVATIVLIVTSLNLEASFIRARYDFEEELDEYVNSMLALYLLSTVLWFLAALWGKDFFLEISGIPERYFWALILYLLAMPAITIFQTVERFRYHYKWSVAISVFLALSTSLLSVALVTLFANRLDGRIIGYVLPVVIGGFGLILYYFLKVRKVKPAHWKYALKFSLPFIPHLLSMLLLGSIDRVMIHQLCGAEDLALYSLAYTCGTLITVLVSSVNSAYSPWLGEQLSKGRTDRIRVVCVPYVLFFAFFACCTVMVTPELLFLLGGENYLEAVAVMPPVAAGCFMQFLYTMYVNVEQYDKKTAGMATASVVAALLNYVLNAIFIPYYGYLAAAYTTFIGYLALLGMHMYLVKRIGRSAVYKNKTILAVAVVISLILFSMTFLFATFVPRYIILMVLMSAGALILYRKRAFLQALRNGE